MRSWAIALAAVLAGCAMHSGHGDRSARKGRMLVEFVADRGIAVSDGVDRGVGLRLYPLMENRLYLGATRRGAPHGPGVLEEGDGFRFGRFRFGWMCLPAAEKRLPAGFLIMQWADASPCRGLAPVLGEIVSTNMPAGETGRQPGHPRPRD